LLSVVGSSGAGKTTLCVALLARWRAAGRRVGYLKHASHGFEVDRPGKDSYRATEAGAEAVALVGPQGAAILLPEAPTIEEVVERCFPAIDLALLEGFREAALPSVLVLDGEPAEDAVAAVPGPLVAIVGRDSRGAEARGVPVFPPDNPDLLGEYLESRWDWAEARRPARVAS
jgi:molybdopterin-guanine dinucleotide biosynthesis protein MobB